MNEAIRDVLVSGHRGLIDALELSDPADRHVLAPAIRCGAQAFVTFNLRDFPAGNVAAHGVEAIHPDPLRNNGLVRSMAEVRAWLEA